MNLTDPKNNGPPEYALPDGIAVNAPFDGAVLAHKKTFEPGRTYIIKPMKKGLWPVVICPLRASEEPVFEASLFTCMFLTGDLRVILWETYFLPEYFDPNTTDWITKKRIRKAKKRMKQDRFAPKKKHILTAQWLPDECCGADC